MKTLLEIYNSEDFTVSDSGFVCGTQRWSAKYLYEKVAELEIKFEFMNLRHIDFSGMPWQSGSVESMDVFMYHMNRISNCDPSIPIVMGEDGRIMDGWHRLAKQVMDGASEIRVYRFETYIEPDSEVDN